MIEYPDLTKKQNIAFRKLVKDCREIGALEILDYWRDNSDNNLDSIFESAEILGTSDGEYLIYNGANFTIFDQFAHKTTEAELSETALYDLPKDEKLDLYSIRHDIAELLLLRDNWVQWDLDQTLKEIREIIAKNDKAKINA